MAALSGFSALHLSERQDQAEGRTYANSALDVDMPLMGIDDFFHDFGPEPRSTRFSANGACGEETVANFRRHAASRIRHSNIEHVGCLRRLSENRDRTAGGRL